MPSTLGPSWRAGSAQEFGVRFAKMLACAALWCLAGCGGLSGAAPGAGIGSGSFSGLVDVGGGRKMYLECRGVGAPTVILIGGYRASAADWHLTHKPELSVFSSVARTTRVCAYDRPGTPVDEAPSRSDPVAQPSNVAGAVDDLQALLAAAGISGPSVLVGHSYGGLIAKRFARVHPQAVAGLVLVDALSEGLQDAQTPEQWQIQRLLAMGDIRQVPEDYPDLERVDIDQSFEQVRAAPPLQPMLLAVLSADVLWAPLIPGMIDVGHLPASTPRDFGRVIDAAQARAQAGLAALVPGSLHIVDTHSGHDIHKDQPQLVSHTIGAVIAAARAGQTRLRH